MSCGWRRIVRRPGRVGPGAALACMCGGVFGHGANAGAEAAEVWRTGYAAQLRGFWLAQSVANWTGLQTEGDRREAPFYTDADWPASGPTGSLDFVTNQDPWSADDDTDIEYVYVHLMAEHGPLLTSDQIRDGWVEHINRFIWVSNERARALIDRGVRPDATSMQAANLFWRQIDAQLTTEVFGALAPGMPARALELADLPIATTSRGYAAHAAQFFVVLHALGAVRGAEAATPEGVERLVLDARAFLPHSSKTADIVDTVLADYRANPDPTDWERTRDLIYDRYQLNANANGFRYRGWTESSVNFGSALVCLLYGGGDLRETIRIGTLSGWDSDNPTATIAGLLGLMLGEQAVRDAFPGTTLSERYWISRTRDGLPDHLPDDPDAEDTFSLLADRMLNVVDAVVASEGGVVRPWGWLVPPQADADPALDNPRVLQGLRGANYAVPAAGGTVTASTSLTQTPINTPGSRWASRFRNGLEHDPTGKDLTDITQERYFWSKGAAPDAQGRVTLTVEYSQQVELHTLRFIEGNHAADGGWFETLDPEVRVGGVWQALVALPSEALDPAAPYQVIDFEPAVPLMVDAVRIGGVAGGASAYVTVCEIEVFAAPTPHARWSWDLDGDGQVGVSDLYEFTDSPTDVNQDGAINEADRAELEAAIRWNEAADVRGGRR